MTNERKITDHSGASDERVSTVYRELAGERAPDRLNDAVLRQAAKAARPAYSRSILWTKPVAWAAVVAICLAITLQVTRVPVPDGVPVELPAAVKRSLDAPADAVQQRAKTRQAPTEIQAEMPAAASERVVRQDAGAAVKEEAMPSSAAEFELQEADLLRRADDMVQLQSGRNRQPAQPETSAYAPGAKLLDESVADCDEKARSTPATWYACIVDLEQAGRADAARRQRERLAEAFPDFEMP